MKRLPISELSVAPNLPLYHVGPALDHGPLPSLFYLALSGPDSLTLDPINQPVQFLSDRFLRIFSLTLPAHENGLSPKEALKTWAEEIEKGIDPITPFIDAILRSIEFVIQQRLADPTKIAIAGLSRGGLIASHVAAREERIRTVLQFAPVVHLSYAKEFASLQGHPILQKLDVMALADALCDRHIRFYIGNRDLLVGTRNTAEFAFTLAERAYHKQIRIPQIELIVSPSIGHMGHGTPPEIFRQGANWIIQSFS